MDTPLACNAAWLHGCLFAEAEPSIVRSLQRDAGGIGNEFEEDTIDVEASHIVALGQAIPERHGRT
jgi:hypothetical protein